jgi:hypothetical protein
MRKLFYQAAGLMVCAAADADAAVDQGIHSGEGGGDVLGGLALLALGWCALKLLVSGELIPRARDAAKFLLMIYAPVALWLGTLLGFSQLLKSTGLTKEQAGGWAFVVATALTIAVAKLVVGKSDDSERQNRQPSAEPLSRAPNPQLPSSSESQPSLANRLRRWIGASSTYPPPSLSRCR